MRLAPPRFWSEADHPAGRALAPLGAAYGRIVDARLRRAAPHRAPVPVVCVGNVSMGGVGKTPWTILLARTLNEDGRAPHVLTRGYGGSAAGPLRVAGQDASVVGDEALLLARHAPVWVGADRAASARAAASAGADALLMDDGFQNPGIAKDLSFLLVDAEAAFGNGRVFPAGPLRERPAAAAARADALVSVGAEGGAVPEALERLAQGKPLLRAWMAVDAGGLDPARPVHAFAGIGRPERFFGALRRAGLDVARTRAFPDHHPFTAADLHGLLRDAERAGAVLATTQKDAVRLPQAAAGRVHAVPARMRTDEAALRGVLSRVAWAP